MTGVNHKSCKRTAMRRLQRLSYVTEQLRAMKQDKCPAVNKVDMDDINMILFLISRARLAVRFNKDLT